MDHALLASRSGATFFVSTIISLTLLSSGTLASRFSPSVIPKLSSFSPRTRSETHFCLQHQAGTHYHQSVHLTNHDRVTRFCGQMALSSCPLSCRFFKCFGIFGKVFAIETDDNVRISTMHLMWTQANVCSIIDLEIGFWISDEHYTGSRLG